jgi:hypothetical protein
MANLHVHARLRANLVHRHQAQNRVLEHEQKDNREDYQRDNPECPFEKPFHYF